MKCYICGNQMNEYGNNPYPICGKEDTESRCCDSCNEKVIRARIVANTGLNKKIEVGDSIILFWSEASSTPIDYINDNTFLVGIVEDVKTDDKGTYYTGSWGSFPIRDTDSFTIQ